MKDIAFNPLGFSTQDVQQQVTAGELSSAEIALVFGDELGQAILRAKGGEQLPEGGPCQGLTDSTQIVFWGIPQSGKTLAIASLLAEEGMQIEDTGIPGIDQRISRLRQLFDQPAEFSSPSSASGYTQLPDTRSHPRSENYHAIYKKDWWSAAYPLTFIEARLTGEPFPYAILDKDQDQIHVFCLDCRQDLQQQVEQFRMVLRLLQADNHLENTAAIYVLVTKSDLLNAPKAYRYSCAQTLVTSSLPDFWRELQNVCFDHSIYNTQPIAYSVGDFVLKDFARLTPLDGHRTGTALLTTALLPKCQPRRTFIGRVLDVGKPSHIILPVLLFAGLIVWVLIAARTAHLSQLTSRLEPFDYKANFMTEVKAMAGNDLRQISQEFDRLSLDLAVEQTIHTTTGEPVLSAEDYQSCDSCLVTVYAKLLKDKASTLFSSNNWSEEESQLRLINAQIKKLEERPSRINVSPTIDKYAVYINDYFNTVKPLVEGSRACHSIGEVEHVENLCHQWFKYPYSNDNSLSTALTAAPLSAYRSCAQYFYDRVNTLIADYERMKDEAPWYDLSVYFGDKQDLQDSLEVLQEQVERLQEKVSNRNGSGYEDVRNLLQQALENIDQYV